MKLFSFSFFCCIENKYKKWIFNSTFQLAQNNNLYRIAHFVTLELSRINSRFHSPPYKCCYSMGSCFLSIYCTLVLNGDLWHFLWGGKRMSPQLSWKRTGRWENSVFGLKDANGSTLFWSALFLSPCNYHSTQMIMVKEWTLSWC